jgi:hypothetical protein
MRWLTESEKIALREGGLPVQRHDCVLYGRDSAGDFILDMKTGQSFTVEVDLDCYLRKSPVFYAPRE